MKISKLNTKDTIYSLPSIDGFKCNKCKGNNIFDGVCLDCKAREDEVLYFIKRKENNKNHTLKMQFELSKKQKEASDFFLDHLKNKKEAFLNAVCGSGKTEIMYETILYALNNQLKVSIVIPRKEIVKELKDRLISVFPDTIIKNIDGENHDDECDLLLSTCNQMVNYEKEFDLIILDEADAFPYSSSDYLKRIVRKALNENGLLFKMSATKKEIVKEEEFTINRRYHGTDLSMPFFYKDNNVDITKSRQFIDILNNTDRKFIIFTESIKRAIKLSDILRCEYVSSDRENSREIIEDFKRNNEKILVSTTILERGITIPNLDVIIVNADNEVFNHQTIIQICGRVGRSFKDNKGSIYIFYRRNSIKFELVKRYIRKMNEM